MKDFQFFLELTCFAYLIILIVYLLIVALLFRHVVSSQPWIIWLLRTLYEFTFKVLYIPLITIPISSFDCYFTETGEHLIRGSSTQCVGGDIIQIVTMVVCLVHLILLLVFSSVINIMIFPHNPKRGGLFTCSTGKPQFFHSFFTFGLVFAMRLLWDWPFWRGVVTAGTSLGLVGYYTYMQPFYSLRFFFCFFFVFFCFFLFFLLFNLFFLFFV
jgi:hypothetical protein